MDRVRTVGGIRPRVLRTGLTALMALTLPSALVTTPAVRAEPPPPRFQASTASPFDDLVQGDGWVPDSPLTIEVNPGVPGPVVDWSTDPGGNWRVNPASELGVVPFDLVPGDVVRVTQDPDGDPGTANDIVKETVLVGLTFDVFDPDSDVVGGSSDQPDGTPVEVGVGNEFAGANASTTVSSGSWSVDFGLESPPFDLTADMGGQAATPEAAATDGFPPGDATAAEPIQLPRFQASTASPFDDLVQGDGWVPDSPLTIEVNPGVPGPVVDWSTDPGGNWRVNPASELGVVPFDLVPGDVVRVTQDPDGDPGTANDIVKETVLVGLTFDVFDPDSDVVGGSSDQPDGTPVEVGVGNEFAGANASTTVSSGSWSVDFGLESPPFDLTADMGGQAATPEAAATDGFPPGDATAAEPIQLPAIRASLVGDWIEGSGFPPNSPVGITIDGSTPGSECCLGTDAGGNFNADPGTLESLFGPGFDLVPSNAITVDVLGVAKDLTLIDLAVVDVDFALDTVSGSSDQTVPETVRVDTDGASLTVPVDDGTGGGAAGSWAADFSTIPFDLTPAKYLQAQHFDAEGDATVAEPSFNRISASVTNGWIQGEGFLVDAPLEIDINGTCYPWGTAPDGGFFADPDSLGSPPLNPGDTITVSDDVGLEPCVSIPGAVVATNGLAHHTRMLVVDDLSFDGLRADTDTAFGNTGPIPPDGAGVEVNVGAGGPSGGFGALVLTDSDGNWSADILGDFGQDVEQDWEGQAQTFEDDGDFTVAEKSAAPVDIEVTKGGPATATAGSGDVVQTVTVTNAGPASASGIEMLDVVTSLPAGVTVTNVAASPGSVWDGVDTWMIDELANGDTATLTITYDVPSLAQPGLIADEATFVSANEEELGDVPDHAANSAAFSTAIGRVVDIAVTKTGDVNPVSAGSGAGNLVYTVTATNNGPSAATDVTIADVLTPLAGVTVDSVVESAGSWTSPTWTLPTLAAGATETLTVMVTVGASVAHGAVVTNTATYTGSVEPDGNGSNDSATLETSVIRAVDIVVTKTASASSVIAGAPGGVTFTVTAQNVGPSDATGVAVTDVFVPPPGVSLTGSVASKGAFDGVTWTIGTLAAGGSETLTFTVSVAGSTPDGALITNWAFLTAVNESDLVNLNNFDSATVTVVAREGYIGLTPFRIIDTRSGVPGGIATPWTAGLTRSVKVTGGAVPGDASAVVLQLTADSPTQQSFLTVFPKGAAMPIASSLNVAPGEVRSGQVIATVGVGGQVDIYNFAGDVDLIIDIVGYFGPGVGDGYDGLTPFRIIDTRSGVPGGIATPWTAGLTRSVKVTGGAVPGDASAVVLQLTADSPTQQSFLTVFPKGAAMPIASSLNVAPGEVRSGQVIATVGVGGQVDIYNFAGDVDLIIDIVGYFGPGVGDGYDGLTPFRIIDTRSGVPGGIATPWTAGLTRSVKVTGGAVPGDASAVVLQLTADSPTQQSFLTVFPKGAAMPIASSLNVAPGEVRSGQVIATVGVGGQVDIYNFAGDVDLIIDIVGYFGP